MKWWIAVSVEYIYPFDLGIIQILFQSVKIMHVNSICFHNFFFFIQILQTILSATKRSIQHTSHRVKKRMKENVQNAWIHINDSYV